MTTSILYGKPWSIGIKKVLLLWRKKERSCLWISKQTKLYGCIGFSWTQVSEIALEKTNLNGIRKIIIAYCLSFPSIKGLEEAKQELDNSYGTQRPINSRHQHHPNAHLHLDKASAPIQMTIFAWTWVVLLCSVLCVGF